jgi:hypothetical protein
MHDKYFKEVFMKNFVYIECDNVEELSNEIYSYFAEHPNLVSGDLSQHVVNTNPHNLMEGAPKFRAYLHSLGLSDPKVVHINRCNSTQLLHIDANPEVCMMFPVRNTIGTARTFYYELENLSETPVLSKFGVPYVQLKFDSKKELDSYELSKPVMMNPKAPHQVVTTESVLPEHRIAIRLRFDAEPVHFLND